MFLDRQDAGRRLADKLVYHCRNAAVVTVPRGGVPVGLEIAGQLQVPLDIVVVRKIPIPSQPEAGYGAVSEEGTVSLNERLVAILNPTQSEIETQRLVPTTRLRVLTVVLLVPETTCPGGLVVSTMPW